MNIDPRIIRARSALIMDQPFFGSLAMQLEVIASQRHETMATNGRQMFYNHAFLDTITAQQTKGVIAHEVMHCALNHHTRRAHRDPQLWNSACDYVVNAILVRAGFELPEGAYLDPQYDGLGAEAVYRILDAQKQSQQQQQRPDNQPDSGSGADADAADSDEDDDSADSQGNDDATDEQDGKAGDEENGSDSAEDGEPNHSEASPSGDQSDAPASAGKSSTGPSDPGRCGEILDAAPDHDEGAIAEAEAEWEVIVRQAVNIAKKQNAGTVPGFLEEVVTDLADPRTDWREVLRRFVDPSSTKDYSWARPNRRLMSQGYFNPGLVSDGINHVAILVDTSGSIDQGALRVFGGETQAALDEGAIDKVTVVFADTRVNRIAEYAKGDRIDFTVQGRGGTAFSPAFAWVNENAPDIAAAIYFTDLECDDFGAEPLYPVLWAAYGDPRSIKASAAALPFGECVDVQA